MSDIWYKILGLVIKAKYDFGDETFKIKKHSRGGGGYWITNHEDRSFPFTLSRWKLKKKSRFTKKNSCKQCYDMYQKYANIQFTWIGSKSTSPNSIPALRIREYVLPPSPLPLLAVCAIILEPIILILSLVTKSGQTSTILDLVHFLHQRPYTKKVAYWSEMVKNVMESDFR